MEYIVQLFRALANRQRIRFLRLLSVFGEMNVSEIAKATKLVLPLVSDHLKVLTAAGLVWRRRSGRIVHYRLAEDAGNPVTAMALRVARETFGSIDKGESRKVARADQSNSPTSSDAALFACFTAFTHPRRLQIIRHLVQHDMACLAELTSALSMSRRACLRHLVKLERRGFIARKLRKSRRAYVLSRGEGSAQQTVLRAVCEYLTEQDR